jgi:lactate dehydrogenase-like 2-hydroxyacid dehydrogenase
LLDHKIQALVILDEALAQRGGPITAETLSRLYAPAHVVCLARSNVLDETSVPDALKGRKLGGLVLDDYPEAPRVPAIWRQAPHTWVTPAIAAVTEEALADMGRAVMGHIAQHFGLNIGQAG